MNKKPIETIMGLVVLIVAGLFLIFAYRVSDLQVVKGYEIKAEFAKVGGLSVGSDVRLNGIKIGTVVSQKLNPETYNAEVALSISSDIKLPKDSEISVASDGLLGDKFIKVTPGKSEESFQNGDTASNVKNFKTLEDMVGEIIFMVTDNGKKE